MTKYRKTFVACAAMVCALLPGYSWASPTRGCAADRPCFNGEYQKDNSVIFNFTGVVGWEFYNVRYKTTSGEKQVENRSGTFTINNVRPNSIYTISVQGCNSRTFASSRCSPWEQGSVTTAGPRAATARIKSGAGKCLDVHAADQHQNGGRVQVWDCNNTLQQSWRLVGRTIKSGAGKCLDVHAADQHRNGAKVQVWDCNNSVQQTWTVVGRAIKSGAGKCLDVHAADQYRNGGRVQVWDCNNSLQQSWITR